MRAEYSALDVMGTTESILEQLSQLHGSKTLIVGIGNTLKGDDGAGPLVCHQLRQAGIAAEIIDAGTVPENYIQPIIERAPANLLVIDAMDFGASPGTISIFKPQQLSSIVTSTHTLSPRLFAQIVRQSLSAEVYFVGIQPAQTQLGESLSPQVNQAIQRLSHVLTSIFPLDK